MRCYSKFNAFGATLAASAGLAVSATAQAQITNGGFETGDLTGWVVYGTSNAPTISAVAHTGSFSVLTGNDTGAEPLGDSALYQQFAVPAGGGSLTFWTNKFTTDSITFDWQDAYIQDSGGNILQTIFHTCVTQGWTLNSVDLTAYAGQTIRIAFLCHQDAFGDDTSMKVDDVVFASGATPGACCFPNGTCSSITSSACSSGGGIWAGPGVTCAAAACPQPGACAQDGTCSSILPSACAAAGGVFRGAATTCGSVNCQGACCVSGGSCTFGSTGACNTSGGVFWGYGVTCAAAQCPSAYYLVDDGSMENSVGLTAGGAIGFGNAFVSVAGRDQITGIDIIFGSPATGANSINGAAITAAIWSDPNGDGNPIDGTLLASVPGVISNAHDTFPITGGWLHFPITPTTIPAGQSFVAGFVIQVSAAGQFPCALDQTASQGKSYVGFTANNGFDLNAWPANTATIDSFGLAGNWSIRADGQAANPNATGACCLPNGSCTPNITGAACWSAGGIWAGENVTCAAANCPQPGACCRNDGTCTLSPASACVTVGNVVAVYNGAGTTCAAAQCDKFKVVNNIAGSFHDIVAEGGGTVLIPGNQDDGTATFTSSITNALVTNPNLFVCTNGFISDNSTFTTFTNTRIPVTLAGLTFALFNNWDDLYDDAPGSIVAKSVTEGTVNVQIVQWNQVRTFTAGTGGPRGNFQVKIFGPGGPGLAQYLFQADAWDWNGNSSTVGVQWAADRAHQYSYSDTNSAGTQIPDNQVFTVVQPASCYPNCDGSTQAPILNVADFSCFLAKYASQDPYANCDGSTQVPTLNVADFSCFLSKYAAGCTQ